MKLVVTSAVMVTCAMLAWPALAQRSQKDPLEDPEYKFNFDPSLVRPWKEAEVPLPAYPDPANLARVATAPTTVNEVLVDTTSVSSDRDRVVRFSFVVTAGSARNTLHEGFRCNTREYKTYAYGKPDGSWQAMERANWAAIRDFGSNTYRMDLYHLVCDRNDAPRSQREIVRRLKHQVDSGGY